MHTNCQCRFKIFTLSIYHKLNTSITNQQKPGDDRNILTSVYMIIYVKLDSLGLQSKRKENRVALASWAIITGTISRMTFAPRISK